MPNSISIIKLKEAILGFDVQIRKNPNCAVLLMNRAICQEVLNTRLKDTHVDNNLDNTPTTTQCIQYHRNSPEHPRVLSIEELHDAIADLSSEIEQDPSNRELLLNRAICEEVLKTRVKKALHAAPNSHNSQVLETA